MKLPSVLNPLRGTRFAWLIPFTWSLVQCVAVTAPITVEVFLHHRFGARSGKPLLKGFLLLLVVCLLSLYANSRPLFPLFPGYLCAYFMAALGQWLTSQSRRAEHIHSHSSGEPWPLWQEFRFDISTVRQWFEPGFCCLVSCVVLFCDPSLANWLFFAGIALFIKELLGRVRHRTRRLNALDNRAETERLDPRPRHEAEPFVEARPAPPFNRPRP